MAYRSVTHIALHVVALGDAEDFYGTLFDMPVVLREEITMLGRDAPALALEPVSDGAQVAGAGPLAHVGLQVDEQEIERLQAAAERLECRTIRVRPDLLLIRDRYGVQWEVTTIWPPQGAVGK